MQESETAEADTGGEEEAPGDDEVSVSETRSARGRERVALPRASRVKSEGSGRAEGSGTARALPEGYRVDPDRVCGGCRGKEPCGWKLDGKGSCAACNRKKSKCDIAVAKERSVRGPGKGAGKAADARPKKRPRTSSRDESPVPSTVDLLRSATLAALGSTPIPPSAYGGLQPVHESGQQFPGLVANMQAAFMSREDNLWGNYMNVTANTHLQIDGTLRAILAAQQAATAEATRSRIALESMAESLAVVAGSALAVLTTNPATVLVTRDAALNHGLGRPIEADESPAAPMDDTPVPAGTAAAEGSNPEETGADDEVPKDEGGDSNAGGSGQGR